MSLDLPTPDQFPAFPYDPPYGIQVDLMRHLYASIEQRKVTIVESPTGTGKTLSLLCAGLTWLTDDKDRAKKGKLAADDFENELDWVAAQTRDRRRRELDADEREYEERLAKARKRESAMKKRALGRVTKKHKLSVQAERQVDSDDESFLPDARASQTNDDNISPEVRALMAKVDRKRDPAIQEEEPTCTKIYYASRTHSQLTQLVPELNRLRLHSIPETPLPSMSVSRKRTADTQDADNCEPELSRSYTRIVSLGSRKQLCINDELRRRTRDLDEGCRELLSAKGDRRCEYLPSMADESRMHDFRDQILAAPKDIEDLASAGRLAHICPYFGSRRAIPQAELVTLPYNLLLQKSARDALGIDLKDQVVIIDEAHNLIPTLLSLSTARLSYRTLSISLEQVAQYLVKFRNRLSVDHVLHLQRLIHFMDVLKRYLMEWKDQILQDQHRNRIEVMQVTELVRRLGRKATGINFLEIESYLRTSKVARKISKYSDWIIEKPDECSESISQGQVPPLLNVENFLLSLTGNNDDGRVTLSIPDQDGLEIKYQLLNPSPHFKDVVECTRSVILAGGTMSPMSDIEDQLLPYLPLGRLSTFSCGHIVPPSSLKTLVVCQGPQGSSLELKATQQKDLRMIVELGQVLLNFTNVIPKGVVVFFPSYKFLAAAQLVWQEKQILTKIAVRKKVFFEPIDGAKVEEVLKNYAIEVQKKTYQDRQTGAILFAVIGAKLSEGLNFSDDLARAVIIIGLPFPNLGSPELQERMKYLQQLQISSKNTRSDAGSELLLNICMNSVNQSIGRAIRHQNDWAALVLVDVRYASTQIQNKLPKWIGQDMVLTTTFGQAMKELGSFYRNKR